MIKPVSLAVQPTEPISTCKSGRTTETISSFNGVSNIIINYNWYTVNRILGQRLLLHSSGSVESTSKPIGINPVTCTDVK